MPQLLQVLFLKTVCGLPLGQIPIKMRIIMNLLLQAVYICLKFHVARNPLKLWFVTRVNRTSLRLTTIMNRLRGVYGFVTPNERQHAAATMTKTPLKHDMAIPLSFAQKIALKPSKFLLRDMSKMGGWNFMSLPKVANSLM
jgi:hypothetical protein